VEKKSSGTVFSTKEELITFRCKAVVMSQGAKPSFPAGFYSSMFPDLNREKVVLGDLFFKREVFKQRIQQLRAVSAKENRKLNIVIIGGSHSGFSAAWMLMNGPATYKSNNVHANEK